MTLGELLPLIQTMGVAPSLFRRWRPLVLKKHARRAWRGKAYIATDPIGEIRIWGNGGAMPYTVSFEDLMADDWEVVE